MIWLIVIQMNHITTEWCEMSTMKRTSLDEEVYEQWRTDFIVTDAVSKSRVITLWTSMVFNSILARFIIFYMIFGWSKANRHVCEWNTPAAYADQMILSLLRPSICRCSFSHLHFVINNNGHRLMKWREFIENTIRFNRLKNILRLFMFRNWNDHHDGLMMISKAQHQFPEIMMKLMLNTVHGLQIIEKCRCDTRGNKQCSYWH